ncbi:MAG: glycosyltransferase [Bacteroidota bacterium]
MYDPGWSVFMSPAIIYLSVINDLHGDQRIHRIASSLREAGHEVHVVGRILPSSQALSDRQYHTHRLTCWFHKGKWFYLEYNIRLFFFLLRQKVSLLNANDLDTLLANYLVSRLKSIPLVYDSHEYFTEVPELIERRGTRAIWLRLEKWLLPKADLMYTVNHSISRIYVEKYDREVGVIRNLPTKKELPEIKKYESPTLIYQGALNVGRGLELMVATMEFLEEFQLVIIGKGDIGEQLAEEVEGLAWKERIFLKGFVPFEKLAEITPQAHIGLSIEEDRGGNYHYASPNKVYDYLQAGIPVIVSDLPEMRKLVLEYDCGLVLRNDERTPKKLAEVIRSFWENQKMYWEKTQNALTAAETLIWENEQKQLLAYYQSALAASSS